MEYTACSDNPLIMEYTTCSDIVENPAFDSPSWASDGRLRGFHPILRIEVSEEALDNNFVDMQAGGGLEYHLMKQQELSFTAFRGIVTDEHFNPLAFPLKTYVNLGLVARPCPWNSS
jgi:hypothetical protein